MRFAAIAYFVLTIGLIGCAGSPLEATFDSQVNSVVASPEPEPSSSAYEPTSTSELEVSASKSDSPASSAGILQEPEDIALQAVDDYGSNYVFFYDGEEFLVYYQPDCWKVYDSYRITNKDDLVIICQALLNEHEIHGRDLVSFRTAEDMAYEWQQHNLAYALAPKNSSWRESAQNVDLDPDEQNMTLEEIYLEREDFPQ